MNYNTVFPADTLNAAGLTMEDVELSIGLAHNVGEAVKHRRAAIREQTRVHGEAEEARNQREVQEKADDDRVFFGTIVLLAQKMKSKSQSGPQGAEAVIRERAAKSKVAG